MSRSPASSPRHPARRSHRRAPWGFRQPAEHIPFQSQRRAAPDGRGKALPADRFRHRRRRWESCGWPWACPPRQSTRPRQSRAAWVPSSRQCQRVRDIAQRRATRRGHRGASQMAGDRMRRLRPNRSNISRLVLLRASNKRNQYSMLFRDAAGQVLSGLPVLVCSQCALPPAARVGNSCAKGPLPWK